MKEVRVAGDYDPLEELSGPFRVPAAERSYGRQFAQVYDYRLAVLRRRVLAAATQKFEGKVPYVERVLDIPPKQLCFVIGTVYASMRLKPDVLQEIAHEQSIAAQSVPTYADPGHDEIFVEDQSGRVRLVGDKIQAGGRLANLCVTGAVIGVFGAETPDGDLEVADLAFSGPPPPRTITKPEAGTADRYIALVSGLGMGSQDPKLDLSYDLLLEWLSGELGRRSDVACISSIVLAGDSLERSTWEPTEKQTGTGSRLSAGTNPSALFSMLDPWLAELCATMDSVVLLPGALDPSSATIPQQPFQRGLLPRAAKWPNLHRVTNPSWFALHGKTILSTSGQNLNDLLKYVVEDKSTESAALSMAVNTLMWSHVAPTSPDTLWSYPFKSTDPFVLRAAPDLYIIGNQERFQTTTFETQHNDLSHTVRIVLVPSFKHTQEVVLINMRTLEPHLVALRT